MTEPEPYSAHDYFARLAVMADNVGADGNYAIAAALVVRHGGTELVSFGQNELFTAGDPAGHAEMNAIRQAAEIVAAGESRAQLLELRRAAGSVIVRPAPSGNTESILFATLEPCPMCTVSAINSGLTRVVVAAEDPPSGALLGDRLRRLGPVWQELATIRGLEVEVCQSADQTDSATYLPADLRKSLVEAFTRSRAGLDEKLAAAGVVDLRAAVESPQPARPRS